MTRKRKVLILNELGEDIKYHFVQYSRQKRLVIDAILINDNYCVFNNSTEQQNIANSIIDKKFDQYTNGGDTND